MLPTNPDHLKSGNFKIFHFPSRNTSRQNHLYSPYKYRGHCSITNPNNAQLRTKWIIKMNHPVDGRNPAPPGNNGIDRLPTSTGKRRISEPSTVTFAFFDSPDLKNSNTKPFAMPHGANTWLPLQDGGWKVRFLGEKTHIPLGRQLPTKNITTTSFKNSKTALKPIKITFDLFISKFQNNGKNPPIHLSICHRHSAPGSQICHVVFLAYHPASPSEPRSSSAAGTPEMFFRDRHKLNPSSQETWKWKNRSLQ